MLTLIVEIRGLYFGPVANRNLHSSMCKSENVNNSVTNSSQIKSATHYDYVTDKLCQWQVTGVRAECMAHT